MPTEPIETKVKAAFGTTFVAAVLGLLVAFNAPLSEHQQDAILALVVAAQPVIAGVAGYLAKHTPR